MDWAYSIELPANQVSVSVGDLPVILAKTLHPKEWEFWNGREALFDHLTALVWHRVNLAFAGEADAAREVAELLEKSSDSQAKNLLPHLTGHHFYHIYLAAVHGRMLFRAIADGEVERLEHNPTGTVAFDPLAEVAERVIKSADRIPVRELPNYLKRFYIGLRDPNEADAGETLEPLGPKKLAEGVNEVRGRLILEQLTLLGHDPMDMEYENGVPGIKSEVRERIWQKKPQEFAHPSKRFDDKGSYYDAFRHAWNWLSENDLISHLPVQKK